MDFYQACHCCGLIQRLPPVSSEDVPVCFRCETRLVTSRSRIHSASRTAAAACGAFVLFWPAILLPVLKIEKLGHVQESSILGGIIDLLRHGNWFVGVVVLIFSILFPLTKLLLLLELSLCEFLHRRHKAATLRLMEHLGKWSMMDVMLLAFLVMLVKLGNLVQFQLGPAVVAFTLCVTMSMIASLSFDPHSIWEETS
ncbi:MAG: paraquat-inducible protein A [Planctomycetaceae bacterium]|nr:paraquat-inducible protein A [Planctomycetaceae bacterium]